MNVEIAERLARRRKEAGYSQEELALKLGVSRQAVSKWERSESSPDTNNLIALAQLYNVSLDDLLFVDSAIADDVAFEMADRAQREAEAAEAEWDEAGYDGDETTAEESEQSMGGTDYVNISWKDGVHVRDSASGEEVHVGWKGIHITDGTGEAVSGAWSGDEGVFINGTRYESWWDAHEAFDPTKPKNAMRLFPYPVLVALVFLWIGFTSGMWWPGALLFLTIPLYYMIVDAFISKSIAPVLNALYAIGVSAWYVMNGLDNGIWHPTWLIFLTIPLFSWLVHVLFGRRRKEGIRVGVFAGDEGDVGEVVSSVVDAIGDVLE